MEKITQKQRFIRATFVGAAGGAVALAIVISGSHVGEDWSFVSVATAGAFLAGLLLARGFGGQGAWAFFRAGLFFSMATILGAIFAVALIPVEEVIINNGRWLGIAPVFQSTFIGPAFVGDMVSRGGLTTAIWLVCMAGSYVIAQWTTAPRVPSP